MDFPLMRHSKVRCRVCCRVTGVTMEGVVVIVGSPDEAGWVMSVGTVVGAGLVCAVGSSVEIVLVGWAGSAVSGG